MLFPVWRELLCDGETPVGVFARLRGCLGSRSQHSFLLESVVGGERWARWSFIGVGHRALVRGWWREGRLVVECEAGPGFEPTLDALSGPQGGFGEGSGAALIEALLARYRGGVDPDEPASEDELPRFWGGLVGVWGHDMVRDLERIPMPAWASPEQLPAFELLVTDTLVVFDNLSQKVRVFATACPAEDGGVDRARDAARSRVDAVIRALRQGPTLQPRGLDEQRVAPPPQLAPDWIGAGFPQRVEQAKQHVESGDVFQVVLSQRFDQPRARDGLKIDPLDVYRMLRVTNPAPYMYLLELPSASLAGASPEVLVRVDPGTPPGTTPGTQHQRVTVRPLAGTRGRGRDKAEDQALERELLADPKERAEHLMLIDLGRNDIGRIAAAGTVEVEASFEIERYSKVMHIVSEVSGTLADGLTVVDALRSTFPAGTLSGAPKVRALQIIDELEPAPRGWYGGAVGYFGFDGGADFAICIRTVVLTDDSVRVQAGAGIVYDSDPHAEDDECARKAAAVLRAIELARARAQTGEPT
ncbi:Anthranilate synthase, aminase component [Enhygromyxa salina]|uniref:Anthranilate synthase component 1 n=1 Tax=Enhygromyxa salina TaxID=215803 RepID=A0A0C1ZE69_9BACT|nr:anthranilate synthase component I family protein [Enhygromyxa salina]KIG15969.1 Anthranilate synthase, aminase component [Enhygromyxa salina]